MHQHEGPAQADDAAPDLAGMAHLLPPLDEAIDLGGERDRGLLRLGAGLAVELVAVIRRIGGDAGRVLDRQEAERDGGDQHQGATGGEEKRTHTVRFAPAGLTRRWAADEHGVRHPNRRAGREG